ncbi:hypothetical protein IPM65_02435 [Candidatus Roizmanbacteria bacterium]|nr:MAG: hypothetical protein IPM65_02435 [Candidatus Roizmanbacteria bacterium]
MHKQANRVVRVLFFLLVSSLALSYAKGVSAAGQCGTQDDRHYLNVRFYDENGNIWATNAPDGGQTVQLSGCRPPPERAPVQVGRPDLPDTPMDNWVDGSGNWRRWICRDNLATAQIRTYRCDTLPPNEFVYIDVWTYPPYDPNLTEWTYIDTGDGETFSGVGPRVTIPNSDLQDDSSGRYHLNVQMVLATTDIQGFKVKMPGNYTSPSTDNQTVTLANGATTIATTTANPYYFLDLDPQPTYTVSVTQPAVNYAVGYTLCFNATNCHTSGITMGNAATFNSPAGGYSDLWWHYWEYIGWYRLKQASFTKQGAIVNFIPVNTLPYDAYDTNQPLLNIRQAAEPDGVGLVTSGGGIDLGPGNGATVPAVSQKNWAKLTYSANKGYLSNLGSFLSYARAKKEIKTITNINDLESNKINIFQGNLTLQNNTINPSRDNMVLIVQGNLTIQSAPGNNFNQARRSWGFIVTGQINVNPSINEMNGVFIANNFDLAYGAATSTTPLKVVGNLISNTPLTNIKRYRPVADYQRASLYVVFYPEYYYDLVPYLSTITQEGRQLE